MYLPGLEFWVRCRVLDLMVGPCSGVLKKVSVCHQLTSCSSMRFNKPPGMEQIFLLFFILPSIAVYNIACGCNCCQLSREMITDFAILSDLKEKLARNTEAHSCVGIPLAAYSHLGLKLLVLIFVHSISLIQ